MIFICTGESISNGVYFSPFIEVAEKYTNSFEFDGEEWLMAIQCKVNPSKIKIPKKESELGCKARRNDYWVINNSHDIRPYRILIKKKSQPPKNCEGNCSSV